LVLLALAAGIYANIRGIAWFVAAPIGAAFLLEFPFYLLPGFERPRAALEAFCGTPANGRLALLQTASALLPWLVCSLAPGRFNPAALLLLAAIAGVVSFWYVLWPPSRLADATFLAILAGVILSKIFDRIYPMPIPKLSISILGHIMLIRVAAMSIFCIRGETGSSFRLSFRFLPARGEWLTGLRYFVYMLPVAGTAYVLLGLAELRPHPQNVFIAAGTFLGILWVVALSEEFFFRGLMQNWFGDWFGDANVALIATSLLFGSVHLAFRFHGAFPNWRFATVAAIAGFFYGLAARSSGTIQASMVTHALTVTVWRVFLH
jgi:membrane protease YdiL (CAAX protease family)